MLNLTNYNIIELIPRLSQLSDTFKDLKLTVDAIHDKEAQFYEARIREQQLVNRQQQMEFEMLASQINPHFLYNTLETIRMQALSCGNRNVATSIKLLGKSMRYVLDNTGTSFTTLTKELEYIKTYLSIQQLRFGERKLHPSGGRRSRHQQLQDSSAAPATCGRKCNSSRT